MKNHILWDLDGTLTDPKAGIIRCFQYALRELGHPVPNENALSWIIGPPLHKSFAQLLPNIDEANVWKLVEKYRERFSKEGIFENDLYESIPRLLAGLNSKLHYLATSKPQIFAQRITDHFKISNYFVKVYGSELDGRRSNKADLIEYILEQENISGDDALMIGDREHDILGAKAAGISSIGITWGYGSREEIVNAGADFIFDSPETLREFLATSTPFQAGY